MTVLTLVSPASIDTGVGDVVFVSVTVSDDTPPVFSSTSGRRLAASRDEVGIWTASWVTEQVGTFGVQVTAGAAAPVLVTVTATDDGPPPPQPGDYFVDEVMTAIATDPNSGFRAAQLAEFASLNEDGELVIGGEVIETGGGGIALDGTPIAGEVPIYNSLTGTFQPGTPTIDPRTNVYNATATSLAFARAGVARAAAGGAPLRIRCTGDSITGGTESSAPANSATGTSYPARLRQRLTADGRYGNVSSGPTYLQHSGAGIDSRVTAVGTWGAEQTGYNQGGYSGTNPSGFVFTPDSNVDTFMVLHVQQATSAVLTAQVDGGATLTKAVNGATDVGVWIIPAGSLGAHTLTLGGTNGKVFIQGIHGYNSAQAGGVQVSRCGQPSAMFSNFAQDATFGGVRTGFRGWIPDIEIIHFGTNDYESSTPSSAFKSNYAGVIARARANFCDPVIVVPVPRGAASSSLAANHAKLVADCYAVAEANDCMLVDLDTRWHGPDVAFAYSTPVGWMTADLVHPSDKGYADMGAAIGNALVSVL
jgi:lysophospholipase L1-like esterase